LKQHPKPRRCQVSGLGQVLSRRTCQAIVLGLVRRAWLFDPSSVSTAAHQALNHFEDAAVVTWE
jgi:hypothetical protein